VEDEDNEFDDKGMNKASQYFNSVLRVLMNAEDYPNDDGYVVHLFAFVYFSSFCIYFSFIYFSSLVVDF